MDPTRPLAITISRQMGSGGAYIGRQLAQRLGFHYHDRESIAKAVEAYLASDEDEASREERFQSMWSTYLSFNTFSMENYQPPLLPFPSSFDMLDVESKVIERIAEKEASVIVGRCGFHALREHANHVAIFLHASGDFRRQRIRRLYNLSEEDARDRVAESDKERSNRIQDVSGRKWTDSRPFDLCVDTCRLGIDKSVDLILEYLKIRNAG